jgi:hypothetical protein
MDYRLLSRKALYIINEIEIDHNQQITFKFLRVTFHLKY